MKWLMQLVWLAWAASFACCVSVGALELETRAALNVLNDVVTPASKLAFQGCLDKEQVDIDAVKDGGMSSSEALSDIAKVRKRCDQIHEIFDQIRVAQNDAVDLVQKGAFAEAKEKIADARGLFQAISTKLGGAP